MRSAPLRLALVATALFTLASTGCAKDPPEIGAGGSGGGVDAGTSGAGGASCDASILGGITVPAPLISVGLMVTSSPGVGNAGSVVDGYYHSTTAAAFPTTLSDVNPAWIGIRVVSGADGGAPPTRLMLAWTDGGYMPYNTVVAGAPGAYRIETSGDTTNGGDGTWHTVADVPSNTVGARAHTFDFTGMTWVRFTVTVLATAGNGIVQTRIDEIALHDISASGPTARPADSWFFFGDSITQGGFQRNLTARFDSGVHADHPAYFPVMLNGGIGGEFAHDGLRHIKSDGWLTINQDFQHVAILFGTNDSWGDKVAASTDYEASMTAIVDAIIAAGQVPVLARIPYAMDTAGQPTMHATIPAFNAIVDRIAASRGLPCGPDFYAYFQAHPDELGPDGVHPADSGYASMNRLWTEAMSHLYPGN